MRVGIGYDVHRLVEGRKLIIGGVEIPYEKGLLGHSDADVLTHTIMDALLGAARLGDLVTHLPETAEEFKDIIAQEPKMNPHLPLMKEILAKVLEISIEDINLKATTEEGLGFTGTKEGMASQAVVLIDKRF